MSIRLFRARGAAALLAAGCIVQPAAAQFALPPSGATGPAAATPAPHARPPAESR